MHNKFDLYAEVDMFLSLAREISRKGLHACERTNEVMEKEKPKKDALSAVPFCTRDRRSSEKVL